MLRHIFPHSKAKEYIFTNSIPLLRGLLKCAAKTL